MSTDMQTTNDTANVHASGGNSSDGNPHAGTEAAARIVHDLVDRVAKIAGQSEEKLRKVSTSAEDSVKQSLEVVRDKFDVARDKLNDAAHDSLDVARNKLDAARSKLDVAKNKGDAMKTSVTGFIQEHPFAALGIAFGTGVLLSYLTRGGRSVRVEHDDDGA